MSRYGMVGDRLVDLDMVYFFLVAVETVVMLVSLVAVSSLLAPGPVDLGGEHRQTQFLFRTLALSNGGTTLWVAALSGILGILLDVSRRRFFAAFMIDEELS